LQVCNRVEDEIYSGKPNEGADIQYTYQEWTHTGRTRKR
jgi:hypothetical protein